MKKKVLIPLFNNYVAPRFDLANEVLITDLDEGGEYEEKIVMLPNASAEQLCHMVLMEHIDAVICGGIEEEYYQYLKWKKVEVLDSVMGTWKSALEGYSQNIVQNSNLDQTPMEGNQNED